MKVEVEIEDLETVVFATAALKTIEGALQSRKEDPFVKPHLNFTPAHNNLVAAMNGARRSVTADTATLWDGELNEKEIKLLQLFVASPVHEVDSEYRKRHTEIDSLASKGCLRIGQLVAGALWPGESKPDIRPIEGYALTMTPRGTTKLYQALGGKNETKS